MSPSEVRHRVDHAGLELGTHLLFCTSAWQLAVGYTDFVEFTGLGHDQVFSGPVVATPVPRYADHPAGPRRWSTVPPEALWHPLFWLPERLWRRRTVGDLVEPEPVWAVRICLEVQAAGLYEPNRGWVDVLADHGIRTENPDDMSRVLSWLGGAADPTLDRIDLTGRLLDDNDGWAADTATGLVRALHGRAWAVIADELLGYLDEPSSGPADTTEQITTVAQLAQATFEAVDTPHLADPAQFWTSVEVGAAASSHDNQRLADLTDDARTWLDAVRLHYWRHIELLDQVAGAAAGPESAPTREEAR